MVIVGVEAVAPVKLVQASLCRLESLALQFLCDYSLTHYRCVCNRWSFCSFTEPERYLRVDTPRFSRKSATDRQRIGYSQQYIVDVATPVQSRIRLMPRLLLKRKFRYALVQLPYNSDIIPAENSSFLGIEYIIQLADI